MNQPSVSTIEYRMTWRFTAQCCLFVVLVVYCSSTNHVIAQSDSIQDESLFQAAIRETQPLSADEQQATFTLPDGFRISCFASEPDLQKPMNMAFDADGRLWVTGSNEYPIPAADGKGHDTIRVLEDTTGDGRADSVKVFADDLNIPIGLLPYGNGVIVFSIPDILYLQDTDADGIADKRTRLYGPFDTSRDTHGMTNSFTAYHDGWIYACHGFNNQSTVAGSDGHAVTMISGNTYRFRPDGSRIEIVTRGQVNPFGMTFDEFGDLYTSDCHSKPVNLLINGGYHESFGRPHDGLGFIPDVMQHQHGSTAIDGVCWYDGTAFPDSFQGNLFLGNVMTSRIHRNGIVRDGATVTMQQKDDFVISSDPWFRPVDIQCGPDGCLYIADFYNRIIGHYEVPLDHPGRDRSRGRIWKVEYVGETSPQQQPSETVSLSKRSIQQLIDRLNDHRLQVRLKAADLLVTKHGDAAAQLVRTKWNETVGDVESKAAAHLLWVMHRLKILQIANLQQAMKTEKSVLRIHTMKVSAERKFSDSLTEQIRLGLRDSDSLVQRAAAGAAAKHACVDLFKELVNAFVVCPDQDVHLKHSVKIALRNQLQDDQVVDWFLQNTQPDIAYQTCAEVLYGLTTKRTTALVLAVIKNGAVRQTDFTSLIGHAAGYANTSDATRLVQIVSSLPDIKTNQLVQIRQVLADAFARNSEADLTEFRAFEARLLSQLIEDVDVNGLNWGRYQWDDRAAGEWKLEDREKSTSTTSRFLSSLPAGESAVSVLRSKSFVIPFRQDLELCGHMGAPSQPALQDNRLMLRETRSGKVLKTELPPRQDQAVKVTWKLSNHIGSRAILELHDGIDESAYAWLALGPISPAVVSLSNGQQSECQRQLKTVVKILETRAKNGILQPEHLRLLADIAEAHQVDGTTRQAAASILFRQRGLSALAPLSVLLKFGRVSLPVQNRIAKACAIDEPWIERIIRDADLPESSDNLFDALPIAKPSLKQLQVEKPDNQLDRSAWILDTVQAVCGDLPEFYRIRVAREMATTKDSSTVLLQSIETGIPSASILRDATLVNLLKSHGQQLANKVDELLESVPQEELVPQDYISTVLKMLQTIQTAGDEANTTEASVKSGKVVFERHCVVCHRVDNQGGLAGPQLDGIQTRGPERLLEDILYPHRNVDVAFQSSVVVLKTGKSISGLVRPHEDNRKVTVVTADGKTQDLLIRRIDEQIKTSQSLMPSGFHKLLSEQQMADLLTWLTN